MTDTGAAAVDAGTDTGTNTATTTTTNTAAATAQPANDSWFDSLDPDTQKWSESKGWAKGDPTKVIGPALNSYRNAEKLISQIKGDPNRIIVMPKDMNNAEEVAAYREKLGVPRDIKDYGLNLEDANVKSFAEMAHQNGIPKEAATKFTEWAKGIAETSQAAQEQEYQQKSATEMQDWQKEQGANFDAKMQAAKTAHTMFPQIKERSAEIEKAMGTKAYMQFLSDLGAKVGETRAAGSNQGSADGGLSIGMARQKIQEMSGDPTKFNALMDDSHPNHAATKAEWVRLHQAASPNQ